MCEILGWLKMLKRLWETVKGKMTLKCHKEMRHFAEAKLNLILTGGNRNWIPQKWVSGWAGVPLFPLCNFPVVEWERLEK